MKYKKEVLRGKHHTFWTLIVMRTINIKYRKWVLKRLKKNLNGVSVRLNENIKIQMGLKIEIIWYIYIINKKKTEFNLLHNIINPPENTKNSNRHYCPILHKSMNTIKGRSNFKTFQILLDSGYSPMIITERLVEKLIIKKYAIMQWHTQAENITTNHKVTVDFT